MYIDDHRPPRFPDESLKYQRFHSGHVSLMTLVLCVLEMACSFGCIKVLAFVCPTSGVCLISPGFPCVKIEVLVHMLYNNLVEWLFTLLR